MAGTLDAHGIAPGALTLEIVEHAVIDSAQAKAALHRLREAGVRPFVADFGVGGRRRTG